MSKMWLEFDTEEDEDAIYMALNGLKFYVALRDVAEMCRNEIKHGELTQDSLLTLATKIRQTIQETEFV